MSGPAAQRLSYWLTRVPVLVLGLLMAVSALQAACGGSVLEIPDDASAPLDSSPSLDSPENRADGMSYGDAYGK
jgi:hypothetical protein